MTENCSILIFRGDRLNYLNQHFPKTVKTSVEKKFCSEEQIDSLLQILEEKIVDQKQVYASKPFTSNTYGKVLVDTVERMLENTPYTFYRY